MDEPVDGRDGHGGVGEDGIPCFESRLTQVARRWLLPCGEVNPIHFDPKAAKFRR